MTSKLVFDKKWITRLSNLACKSEISIIDNKSIQKRLKEVTNDRRTAAVLVTLCNRNGEASMLYTVRSQQVGTHKGQVSFPGGHIGPQESAEMAAMRETYEEIGSNIGNIQIFGKCQSLPAITGTLVITYLLLINNNYYYSF